MGDAARQARFGSGISVFIQPEQIAKVHSRRKVDPVVQPL
jgi:hypothetical protein